MASLGSACRCSARAVSKAAAQHGRKGYRSSAQVMAAHNFSMPAMSPTMTEGNIAKWNVKEGESFSTGDVLLEIETDKATMDVEAQDDGILAKIMQSDGAKSVKVGTRIAVLAEPDDDIKSLEIPPEDSSSTKAASPKPEREPEKPTGQPREQEKSQNKKESSPASSAKASAGKTGPQKYPLYPSVSHLLHENGMDKSEAEKMPATGPNGRLLKGDVLAYLGKIEKSYPGEVKASLDKLSHLDLSNIKVAKPASPPTTKQAEAPKEEKLPELPTEVAVPVSLSEVLKTQKRLREALGLELPLSTFIARAVELANQDLPAKTAPASADDLFNAVLGIPSKSKSTTGHFIPHITALPPPIPSQVLSSRSKAQKPKSDILDMMAGRQSGKRVPIPTALPGLTADANIFSLTVPKEEVKRAEVFLGRVKGALEQDVGTLVL